MEISSFIITSTIYDTSSQSFLPPPPLTCNMSAGLFNSLQSKKSKVRKLRMSASRKSWPSPLRWAGTFIVDAQPCPDSHREFSLPPVRVADEMGMRDDRRGRGGKPGSTDKSCGGNISSCLSVSFAGDLLCLLRSQYHGTQIGLNSLYTTRNSFLTIDLVRANFLTSEILQVSLLYRGRSDEYILLSSTSANLLG